MTNEMRRNEIDVESERVRTSGEGEGEEESIQRKYGDKTNAEKSCDWRAIIHAMITLNVVTVSCLNVQCTLLLLPIIIKSKQNNQ